MKFIPRRFNPLAALVAALASIRKTATSAGSESLETLGQLLRAAGSTSSGGKGYPGRSASPRRDLRGHPLRASQILRRQCPGAWEPDATHWNNRNTVARRISAHQIQMADGSIRNSYATT